ncbi:hypothetical protein HYH03_009202 [Edaphochlamys debaryana]|uniref:F-box domain-containing protein n=1 Tax=Edaphochlamys debaryana TaxID=47281 RepID=A0A836BY21_9CHLO|nr:hypothetical protein HYH03_009202 [Edaphochlamys debaryana]|eukprot:KAG2492537.1 hypothetical protein HYH03_009202 [Edaphochlamys debaryana]
MGQRGSSCSRGGEALIPGQSDDDKSDPSAAAACEQRLMVLTLKEERAADGADSDPAAPAPEAARAAPSVGALEDGGSTAAPDVARPDWLQLPSEVLGEILKHLNFRSLMAAVVACRGLAEAAAKQGVLKAKRKAVAQDAWWVAVDVLPVLAGVLAEPYPSPGAWGSLRSTIMNLRSPPRSVLQLFFALELLWARVKPMAGRSTEGDRPVVPDPDQLLAAFRRWNQWPDKIGQSSASLTEAEFRDDGELRHRAWPLEDTAWRKARRQAALRMLDVKFPILCLSAALPLSPGTLARLRYRLGLAAAGGASGPGARLPRLEPAAVAMHNPVAGRLASWLLGMEGLMRRGYELEAARAWAWAGPSAPTRSQATAGGGGVSGPGGPFNPFGPIRSSGSGSGSDAGLFGPWGSSSSSGSSGGGPFSGSSDGGNGGSGSGIGSGPSGPVFSGSSGGGGSGSGSDPSGPVFSGSSGGGGSGSGSDPSGPVFSGSSGGGGSGSGSGPSGPVFNGSSGGGGSDQQPDQPLSCSHLYAAARAARVTLTIQAVRPVLDAFVAKFQPRQVASSRSAALYQQPPLFDPWNPGPTAPDRGCTISDLAAALAAWEKEATAAGAPATDLAAIARCKLDVESKNLAWMALVAEREAAALALKACP